MPITHKWEGTTLVITSDSGTSSCDLQGARGPQGSPGDCVASDTAMLGGLPAENYALKTYADSAAAAVAANMPKNAYNILHNSYFLKPINQRGETSYSGAAQNTIDRWKTTNNNTTVAIENGGIRLTNTTAGGGGYLQQTLEYPEMYLGKTYTFAAMLEDGTILSNTATLPTAFPANITQYATLSHNGITVGAIQLSNTSVWVRVWSNTNEDTRLFKWAALYEGEYNANTLPQYVYKGYAAELAECERFYRRINAAELLPYSAFISGGNKRLAVNFGYANIRTATPDCVMSDDFLLVVRAGTGGYSSITGSAGVKPASVVNGKANSIQGGVSAYFEFESQFTEANNMAVVAVIKQGYLEIKADL